MRNEFEKLPEIAELLIEAQLDEQTGEYVSYWGFKSGYLNGSWYAFQEQQKKIDAIIDLCNNRRGDIHWQVDYFIEEIEELLK